MPKLVPAVHFMGAQEIDSTLQRSKPEHIISKSYLPTVASWSGDRTLVNTVCSQ